MIAPTNCHWDPAVAPPVPAGPMESLKVSPQTIQDAVGLLTNGKKTGIVLGSHSMYGDGLELAGASPRKQVPICWERPPLPASPEERAAFRSNSFHISRSMLSRF